MPSFNWRGAKPFISQGQRRSFTLAVFVRMGHQPIVVEVRPSPSTAPAASTSTGKRTPGSSSAMNTQDYISILQQSFSAVGPTRSAAAGSTRQSKVNLLHDRHTSHTSKAFAAFAQENGIKAELLPAKAADLCVLDYGVFAGVKNKWRRQVEKERLDWDGQCKALVNLIKNTNPDAYIAALPARIQKCIDANGSHFEK